MWTHCLKPPTPPLAAGLRINNWDGAPLEFAAKAQYVCKRGYRCRVGRVSYDIFTQCARCRFEDDPTQEFVEYTCQGETRGDLQQGFFDTPKSDADWPRCLEGLSSQMLAPCIVCCVLKDTQRQQRVSLSAPLCPKPPEIPQEGVAAYAPLILEDAPLEACEVEQSALTLKCPSFTRLFVVSTEFGRRKGGKVTNQNTSSGHVTEYSSVIGRQGAVHRGKGHCGAHQRGLHLPGRQVSCDWLISAR